MNTGYYLGQSSYLGRNITMMFYAKSLPSNFYNVTSFEDWVCKLVFQTYQLPSYVSTTTDN